MRSDQPRASGARRSGPTEDERLLAAPVAGPDRRTATSSEPWRVLRIMGEFVEGFDTLADVRDGVTLFGSARVRPEDPMYASAVETSRLLARAGFTVITGGGPGIMEAGNKGARLGDGHTIGLNIELPFEQGTNEYVETSIDFRYFFVRKTMFVKYSIGFVVFPGGFGTMDELFEALTLIQTGKIKHFPVVLFGSRYWQGLLGWLRDTMAAERKIDPRDLNLFSVTDDPTVAVQSLTTAREQLAAMAAESATHGSYGNF
jgi:uncharacterized protein (TIGR00730 family)